MVVFYIVSVVDLMKLGGIPWKISGEFLW